MNMLYTDSSVKFLSLTGDLKNMKGYENQDLDEFFALKFLGK